MSVSYATPNECSASSPQENHVFTRHNWRMTPPKNHNNTIEIFIFFTLELLTGLGRINDKAND